MNKLKSALLITSLLTISLHADMFIKQKQHTDGYTIAGNNVEETNEVINVWIGEKGLRSDGEGQSILVRNDTKNVYIIDHTQKEYTTVPFSQFDSISDAITTSGLPDFVTNMIKMTATVTPTSETKKIGNYNCKKYLQTIKNAAMSIETVLWVTKDIKVDVELYKKYLTSMLAATPAMRQLLGDISKEIAKIDGVYVLSNTVTNTMGNEIKSSAEVLEVKEGTAPAGTYDLPAKYKEVTYEESDE
jgi:hypothetical protein